MDVLRAMITAQVRVPVCVVSSLVPIFISEFPHNPCTECTSNQVCLKVGRFGAPQCFDRKCILAGIEITFPCYV